MGSVSSEEGSSDQQSERYGSYCLSADISESVSCSSFTSSPHGGASTSLDSLTISSLNVHGNPGFAPLMFPVTGRNDLMFWNDKLDKRNPDLSETEMMKERFAKLLLGEDMSGGGKGVGTALAISNAITNLSATVFGELWRLEPLASSKKEMWCREMEWLLCVSESIVELVPSIQPFPGGGTYEVMDTRPRSDLAMNLPALKKLDAMLISILDGFQDTEFWYIDKGLNVGNSDRCNSFSSIANSGRPSVRQEEKWWLPCPKVPPKGLSEDAKKKLQQCRDCTNQIFKAALAINSNVLSETEIPYAYLDSLPKSGKACLGEIIYDYITAEQFSPECLLDCLDLSSEHHALEVANRIEAAVHVWRLKDKKRIAHRKKVKRRSWSGKLKSFVADGDKNQFLAQRAEILLLSLRLRFPGLPQTALDMSKIQYNKDVGQSILESYSRVMESLAFNIMARIDDVLYVDDTVKRCNAETYSIRGGGLNGLPIQKRMSPSPFSIQHTPYLSPFGTPTFCLSPPLINSPKRTNKNGVVSGIENRKTEKVTAADLDKLWSYAGNLSARKTFDNAPERH